MRRSAYLLAAVALVFRNNLVHGGDGVLGGVLGLVSRVDVNCKRLNRFIASYFQALTDTFSTRVTPPHQTSQRISACSPRLARGRSCGSAPVPRVDNRKHKTRSAKIFQVVASGAIANRRTGSEIGPTRQILTEIWLSSSLQKKPNAIVGAMLVLLAKSK